MRNTHRQPALSAMKPPMMGPIVGPTRGPITKRAIHLPLWLTGMTSASVPPLMARPAAPQHPLMNRKAINAPTFVAKALPRRNAKNIVVEML